MDSQELVGSIWFFWWWAIMRVITDKGMSIFPGNLDGPKQFFATYFGKWNTIPVGIQSYLLMWTVFDRYVLGGCLVRPNLRRCDWMSLYIGYSQISNQKNWSPTHIHKHPPWGRHSPHIVVLTRGSPNRAFRACLATMARWIFAATGQRRNNITIASKCF